MPDQSIPNESTNNSHLGTSDNPDSSDNILAKTCFNDAVYKANELANIFPACPSPNHKYNTDNIVNKERAVKLYIHAIEIFAKFTEQSLKDVINALYIIHDKDYVADGVIQIYSDAFNLCRKPAEKGDPDAQTCLGLMYLHGCGVKQDYYEAIRYFEKAAEKENTVAQYFLGMSYYFGNGVEQNNHIAIELLGKPAEEGYVGAQYYLGEIYKIKENSEAVKWYKKAAEQGNAWAMLDLGRLYHHPHVSGVKEDYSEALKWYSKAALNGDMYALTDAIGFIRVMFISRCINEQDYRETINWFKNLAEQGNANASYSLGYLNGIGGGRDSSVSFKWYKKAAEQGNASAQRNLGYLYKHGDGVEQNYSEADYWYYKAEQTEKEAVNEVVQAVQDAINWLKKISSE